MSCLFYSPGPLFDRFQIVEICHDNYTRRTVAERDNHTDATALARAYRDAAHGHPCSLTYTVEPVESHEPCGWPDHAAEQDDMLDLMLAARGAWHVGGAL